MDHTANTVNGTGGEPPRPDADELRGIGEDIASALWPLDAILLGNTALGSEQRALLRDERARLVDLVRRLQRQATRPNA